MRLILLLIALCLAVPLTATAQITTSLVAFWELEEASGNRADSHGSHTLTDTNTVTSNTGQVGTAAEFVRANSESLIGADHADLSMGAGVDISIVVWVRLENTTNAQALVAKWAVDGASTQEYILWYDPGADRFRCTTRHQDTSVTTADDDTLGSPADDTFYFVVCTYTASTNTVTIASNGGARTSAIGMASDVNNTTEEFWLGGNENATNRYCDCRLDQVGIWKRVLSEADEDTLYNGGAGLSYAAMTASGGVSGAAMRGFIGK